MTKIIKDQTYEQIVLVIFKTIEIYELIQIDFIKYDFNKNEINQSVTVLKALTSEILSIR